MNNELWVAAYYIPLLLIVAALAAFDIRHKWVPNRALAYFMPYASLSLPINCFASGIQPTGVLLGSAMLGAVLGGTILLAAALATKGGIGGGDIKLTFLLGLVYGPYDILIILFIATVSALFFGVMKRFRYGEKAIRLAFVPFIFFACVVTTVLKFI